MAGIKKAAAKASSAKQVAAAVRAVGSRLSGREAQKLQAAGFSQKQIQSIAGQTKVGSNAKPVVSGGGGGGGGMIKSAVTSVGNTLNKSEAKDLKQQGYSAKQIGKVASRVGNVTRSAQGKIDTWASKAKEKAAAAQHATGGGRTGSSAGSNAIRDLQASGNGINGISDNYGAVPEEAVPTADQSGWLAAELAAIGDADTDITPRMFNNYRPTNLSGQLRDAVAEANAFIDSNRASWGSGDRLTPSVPSISARPLVDDEELERWGLS